MSESQKGEIWEQLWALISVALGEAFSIMAVWPALVEAQPLSRGFLTFGFGLLLGGMFFIVGYPLVTSLRGLTNYVKGKLDGRSSKRTQES